METNFDTISAKITLFIVMLIAAIFSLVVSRVTGFLNFGGLKVWQAIIFIFTQIMLSFGVFIGVVLFFNSSYFPSSIANNDFWTMVVTAFAAGSIPHIIVTALLMAVNREINNLFEKRYGQRPMPEKNANEINGRENQSINKDLKDFESLDFESLDSQSLDSQNLGGENAKSNN